jgi:hypothetical protein
MTQIVENPFGIPADELVVKYGHESVAKYQEWYGLKADGVAGPVTTGLLHSRFCSTPDFANREEAGWPQSVRDKPWAYRFGRLRGLSKDQILQSITLAHEHISKMSAATIRLIEDFDGADIWATSGGLSGGTLAWSYLPNGSCSDRLEQRYDSSNRNWSPNQFTLVLVHEDLHAMGLDHSNDRRDIMYPSINPNATLNDYPGPGDLARMIRLYGERPADPPIDPTDPPIDPTDPVNPSIYKHYKKLVTDMRDLFTNSVITFPKPNGGSGGDDDDNGYGLP